MMIYEFNNNFYTAIINHKNIKNKDRININKNFINMLK